MKTILPLSFVITVLLSVNAAYAQLNESDTARFQLRAGITGVWQSGNVELLALRSRLEMVTNGKKNFVFKSQNNSLYQEFSGFKADNDLNSRNFLYYKPQKSFYPFALLYVQTNFRRKIDYRWFGGAGITWQFVRKIHSNLKLSGGMLYENTRFTVNQFNEVFYNGSENIALWRATMYLAGWHRILNGKVKLFYNAYWQPGFEQVPNNRMQVDVGLELPVWKGLSFQTEYLLTYEQVTAQKVKEIDRLFTFGLSYQIRK
jgi:hypothetical protein